jgi:hypothetical protein
VTLADTLARRGIKFRQSGDKISVCCPWCPSRGKPVDTKFRCCVHVKEGWGKCLHCGWSRRTAIVAVLKQLGINDAVTGCTSLVTEPKQAPVVLPSDFTLLHDATDERDLVARDYILNRGVTEEQLIRYGIGVSYERPWQYRVVFPVFTDNVLRCINGRDFTGRSKAKYLLSRGDKWLAYLDPGTASCVLSEGVIKALRIETATGACSAALLGHDLTDIQLAQIQRSKCRSITLWPDADLVGRRGFIKIADKLAEHWHGDVRMVWPVPGPADDVPLRDICAALAFAMPYTARIRHRMLLEK